MWAESPQRPKLDESAGQQRSIRDDLSNAVAPAGADSLKKSSASLPRCTARSSATAPATKLKMRGRHKLRIAI